MPDFCAPCASQLERSDAEHAPYVHVGPMSQAIQRFKYGARPDLAPVLGRHAAEGTLELVGAIDRVSPVPLHRARRLERGYDQAALLARVVARTLSLPFDASSLVRVRSTGQQVGRDRGARLAAMHGAFEARDLRGVRVLLVDDVITTGATFDAAEHACRAAGAAAVHRLALAAAPD